MKEGYQTSAVWMRGKGNSAPAVLLQGPKPLTTVMVSYGTSDSTAQVIP